MNENTYFPFTRHFSPRASSSSATAWSTPTTTSALFVLRLNIGNEPASGPDEKLGSQILGKRLEAAISPSADSNGVETGHWTSPVNLRGFFRLGFEGID